MVKASIEDSSMRLMEDGTMCNSCYIVYFLNEKFDVALFEKSVLKTIQDISILTYKLKRGFWNDKWVETNNFDIVKKISLENTNEEFYEEAYQYFLKMDGKTIQIEKEGPLKYVILSNKENTKHLVAMCIHHSVCDGTGVNYVSQYVVDCYNSNKHINYKELDQSYRGNIKITKELGLKKCLEEFKSMKPDSVMNDAKPIIENKNSVGEKIDQNNIYTSSFRITEEELSILKKKFEKYGATSNDIVMYYGFQLVQAYNEKAACPNKGLPISMKVNLRRYLSKEMPIACNSFGTQAVILDAKDVYSIDKVMDKIKEIKAGSIGVGYFMSMKLLSIIPTRILEHIIKIIMSKLNDMIFQGISITNLGRFNFKEDKFGECVEELEWIPSGSLNGFPAVAIYMVNNDLKISFTKYNDKDAFVDEITDKFMNIIKQDIH